MYLIRERFFRLGEDSDITDEQGRPTATGQPTSMPSRRRFTVSQPLKIK